MTCATCPKNWRCIMACAPANGALNAMEDEMSSIDKKRSTGEMALITLILLGMAGAAIIIVVALSSRCAPVPNDAGYYGEAHYRALQALNQEEP